MGGRKRHPGSGGAVECQAVGGDGVPESGQPDHRDCGGGRRRIRTGESWRSDRRDMEAGGGQPAFSGNAGVQKIFPEQTVRRTEAAGRHCRSHRHGAEVHRPG